MNQLAIDTFSTFGVGILCITLGIIMLACFLKLSNRIEGRREKPETITLRGVLKKDSWAAVHLQRGEIFERVRFIGFTNSDHMKTSLPYELSGMVILEDPDGKRFLIRAKAITMIVIDPAGQAGKQV